MIEVRLFKTKAGALYGFTANSHGSDLVCAAVSILVQNAVNSIERFTEDGFKCEYDEAGGYLRFTHEAIRSGKAVNDASLLLNSLELGLNGIRDEYENEIKIYTEVDHD